MVVKSDGSKWACNSCLKGHRVSGCNHTDRELTLVPKKGRPVTQCHHCRQERKKRSAHIKCDCGDTEKVHHSKEKCVHLREAEERAKVGLNDDSLLERDPAHLAAVAEDQGCCCHHGGKCTCSLIRKDTSMEKTRDCTLHGPAVPKPRLETTKSDDSITVFANGHHKPIHRKNNAAHECGMPYKMPMPRSQTDRGFPTSARRSVDSLMMDNGNPFMPSTFASQVNAQFNTDRTMSKSEHPSPIMFPVGTCNNGLADARMTSIDFNSLAPSQTNQSMESIDSLAFPTFDPMSGVDGSFDPWSNFPSSDSINFPDNNPFGAWATNFDSSSLAQPALTAASSGTHSDIDEFPAMDETYGFHMPSISEDVGFDGSTSDAASGNRRSLPPNFFGNIDFSLPDAEDWQGPATNSIKTDAKKPRSDSSAMSPSANDAWQMPATVAASMFAQRNISSAPHTGRPQSHSIGPGSAPNDEIIKQLFPDLDVASAFGVGGSPSGPNPLFFKKFHGMPSNDSSSAPVDFPVDEENAFNAQPWTDGSVSVPNDAFASSFNLDQEYSTPDFSASWHPQ